MEKILDIQAVMIIGMEVIEKGVESPYQNPAAVYENRRRGIPVFDDREEEIRYLLQPEYKQFLQAGMEIPKDFDLCLEFVMRNFITQEDAAIIREAMSSA